jgi:hypothetical protein
LGQTSSPGLYDFCGGDPVNFFDPTGRCPQSPQPVNNWGQNPVDPNKAGVVAGELDYLKWALAIGDSQAANQARFLLLDPNGNGFVNIISDVLEGNGSSLSQDQRFAMFQALAASGYATNLFGYPGQEAAILARNNPNASPADISNLMNGTGYFGMTAIGAFTTYQTYTKTNSDTDEVYSGRTSGPGTPLENVANRDSDHHMDVEGFGPAVLDESSSSADAIRGQEQLLIQANGGAQSQGGTSGNKINGVSPTNPNRQVYIDAPIEEFGER